MLYVFYFMLIAGIIGFIVSLVLVVVFKVPELVDELSGAKAKRQIRRLKELNAGTGNLDSANTSDVYKLVSPDPIPLGSGNMEEEDDEIIREVSKEVDTGDLKSPDTSVDTPEEQATGYMVGPINQEDEEENPTGYMDSKPPEVKAHQRLQKRNFYEEEQPTGFMQSMEEDEATGIIADLQEFVKSKQIVEILEEQTSLDLSAVL